MNRFTIATEELFDAIDTEKRGYLSTEILLQGLRNKLDFSVPVEQISTVSNAFDCMKSGVVTKESFMSKLNQKSYIQNCNSEKYMISKCKFLEAVLELYNKVKLNATAHYLNYLSFLVAEEITVEQFKEIVIKVDSDVKEEFIEYMYDETISMQNKSLTSKENIARVLVEYGIGNKTLKAFGM